MAIRGIFKNIDVFPVWTWVPSPRLAYKQVLWNINHSRSQAFEATDNQLYFILWGHLRSAFLTPGTSHGLLLRDTWQRAGRHKAHLDAVGINNFWVKLSLSGCVLFAAGQTDLQESYFFESFRLKEFFKIMLCSVKSCIGLNVLECVLKFMKFKMLNKMHFCACWILIVRIIYVKSLRLVQ